MPRCYIHGNNYIVEQHYTTHSWFCIRSINLKPIYYFNNTKGGDITQQNGSGGKSIYDGPFENENYTMKHGKRGILSMFNMSPTNNTSQFFITLKPMSDVSGRYTAFGRITNEDGFDVLEKIEACVSSSGALTADIVISDCGQLEMDMWIQSLF